MDTDSRQKLKLGKQKAEIQRPALSIPPLLISAFPISAFPPVVSSFQLPFLGLLVGRPEFQ